MEISWLYIVGFVVLVGLFKYLTREKCPRCKSTNFSVSQQHIKSYTKQENTGGLTSNNTPRYNTVQYDEYLVHHQCNDCHTKWSKRITEKV